MQVFVILVSQKKKVIISATYNILKLLEILSVGLMLLEVCNLFPDILAVFPDVTKINSYMNCQCAMESLQNSFIFKLLIVK